MMLQQIFIIKKLNNNNIKVSIAARKMEAERKKYKGKRQKLITKFQHDFRQKIDQLKIWQKMYFGTSFVN